MVLYLKCVHVCLIQALLQIFSKVITFVKMLIIYTVYVVKLERNGQGQSG